MPSSSSELFWSAVTIMLIIPFAISLILSRLAIIIKWGSTPIVSLSNRTVPKIIFYKICVFNGLNKNSVRPNFKSFLVIFSCWVHNGFYRSVHKSVEDNRSKDNSSPRAWSLFRKMPYEYIVLSSRDMLAQCRCSIEMTDEYFRHRYTSSVHCMTRSTLPPRNSWNNINAVVKFFYVRLQ